MGAGLGLSVGLGLVLAVLGGLEPAVGAALNALSIQHRAAALAAGESGAIRRLQYAGLLRDAVRGALLTALGLVGAWALARWAALDRETAVGLTLVAIGAALSAAAGGALRSAGRGARLRWLVAGAVVGTAAGGAPMTGGWRALLRLFAVQGTWNYERMLGVGMGYAAEPLLEDLKTVDPVRHGEAVVRSAEFFNCNPNLAGLALGATARAEYEAVPGAQIARLRTALCSPLGALGDQLFWAGLVPALIGLALAAVVLGAGWWAVLGFLVAYNPSRFATARLGAAHRVRRGHAGRARDRRLLAAARRGAHRPGGGVDVGLAIPLVAAWYLRGFGWAGAIGSLAVAAVGVAVTRWFGPALTTVRFALLAMASPAPLPLGGPVIEREATIVNQEGLHARPAARIVRLASSFTSEIEIAKDGVGVNGKSIMGVMMLAAECGSSITIRANGPDAEQAVEALAELVASGFGEP